ncbi:MAG: ribonuclease HI family protein [Leptospiraceae bacterium]|nr:ribonuclease HI family protein [Leptospiraceae bacterium]
MLYIYCDGASKGNPGPSSIGVVAYSDQENQEEVFTISKSIGVTTNNIAEWSSLISALEKAIEKNETKVSIFMDSELVVKQVLGQYRVKNEKLIPLKNKFLTLKIKFPVFSIQHVYRDKNKRADELANLALI